MTKLVDTVAKAMLESAITMTHRAVTPGREWEQFTPEAQAAIRAVMESDVFHEFKVSAIDACHNHEYNRHERLRRAILALISSCEEK